MTQDQIEEIGALADKSDNFSHASKLNLPAQLHADCLSAGMVEIRDRLRKLYVDAKGYNPWADEPNEPTP